VSATSLPRNPWLEPLASSTPPSLSERLIRALEAHLAAESHDMGDYEQLVHQSTDPVVQLVLGMIIEDAQHHLGLLQRMIRRLQEEVEFTPSLTALPVPVAAPEPTDAEAVASLRTLIRNAHEGSHYLRHLARQEPGLYHGLYAALFETMARDAEKHATLLRYLLRQLERGLPA
jgi:rubrerythrin